MCEQIIVRWGVVVVPHTNESNAATGNEGIKKKFSIELVTLSEHRSLGFYQAQIFKNP